MYILKMTDGNRRFLLIRYIGLSGKQAGSLSKNKPSPAFICIHVSRKYIPLYATDRDITVKTQSVLESGRKHREGYRKGMKHRIKGQIRT